MTQPVWAMPSRIKVKSTGEVGRLEMIHYDYKNDDDLLYIRMDDGRTVRVMGADAEHASTQREVQP